MMLNRRERELLKTIITLAGKVLAVSGAARNRGRSRQRRSRADAAALRIEVLSARRREMSVREIAEDLGITPAYVYQLLR
jgi:hypothetical protein